MAGGGTEEILRMEHITKQFGAVYANRDVNFSVLAGEVHTLLGENGAGKSTLMNVLFGLYQPTEGEIYIRGEKVRIESPAQAVKLGIGMVHQHFMLVEAMTVFENIILGDTRPKGIFIDRNARRQEILELSEKYGLQADLDQLITELSVGAQQRVEILKALYRGCDLLVLDEPTAALTDLETEGLFEIMKKLTEEGKTVSLLDPVYSGDFSASDKGLEFAKAMIDKGADVFFGDASAVDSGARQAIDAANEAAGAIKIYDIAQPADLLGQNACIIGSQVTDNSALIELSMKAVETGTFGGETLYGTLQNDVLSAGKLNADIVPEDVQTAYAGYIQQMTDGTFMGGN